MNQGHLPRLPRSSPILLTLAIVLANPAGAQATTHVSSNITANTEWTVSGSPYVIDTWITVVSGVTLTVDPGVIVKFNGLQMLTVAGVMNAIGNTSSRIVFTSLKDDSVGGDTGGAAPRRAVGETGTKSA